MLSVRKISPLLIVISSAVMGVGVGVSVGTTLDNVLAWLVLGGSVGAAIGVGILIEGRVNRFTFIMLLIAISYVLSVSLTQADSGRVIRIKLSLEEGMKFSQDWPIFVYASLPGSRLPLSSTRLNVSDLPTTVVLTEAMYILPSMTMGGHQELVVTAKVSSGSDVHEEGSEDSYSLSPVLQFSGSEKPTISLLIKATK